MQTLNISDLNILLIEPSDTQRKIISSLLLKEDVAEIDAVSDVGSAIGALKAHGADLVISAMYFTDGTAIDVLKFIKESTEMESIPFMLVSSETKNTKLEEYKQAGISAILPKPFKPDSLKKALKASLDLINDDEVELEYFDIAEIRVLLVDDSMLARGHIRRTLEKMGVKNFVEAENGAMALTFLKDHEFDIVVTDYNMPEMDGRELSEYIRFNPDTAHIPIIMVTSESADSLHMSNIQQTGVNALCDKPFEPEMVKKMLMSLLSE